MHWNIIRGQVASNYIQLDPFASELTKFTDKVMSCAALSKVEMVKDIITTYREICI